MSDLEHVWAIVLAGGDGKRVRAFFTDAHGRAAPKQFCPFDGNQPLVRSAIDRARRVAPINHVVVALTEIHRQWWKTVLHDIDARNLVVQPSNKGTAPGLLLPLLNILHRDRQAKVVVFPSDHFIADEARFSQAVVEGLEASHKDSERVALLGIVPQEADSEYGWILPDGPPGSMRQVASFVEKPDPRTAESLRRRGALLNSFILVGAGLTFLDLYARTLPELVHECASWKKLSPEQHSPLDAVYSALPSFDFSREVLEQSTEHLGVLHVPDCGWTDLGTPERIQQFRAAHLQTALAS